MKNLDTETRFILITVTGKRLVTDEEWTPVQFSGLIDRHASVPCTTTETHEADREHWEVELDHVVMYKPVKS